MTCTLVTAYYPIRSKFSTERYMNWASTFLRIDAPIILFTDESMVDAIRHRRGERPIHIIVLPFEQLETWKMYESNWKEQHHMDPEKSHHTPELYTIWAEKAFFVEKK